jgi:hypothetical protein
MPRTVFVLDIPKEEKEGAKTPAFDDILFKT